MYFQRCPPAKQCWGAWFWGRQMVRNRQIEDFAFEIEPHFSNVYWQLVTRWHHCCTIQIRSNVFSLPMESLHGKLGTNLCVRRVLKDKLEKSFQIKHREASDTETTSCYKWQWPVSAAGTSTKEQLWRLWLQSLTEWLEQMLFSPTPTQKHWTWIIYFYESANRQSSISLGFRVELRAYEHTIALTV